MHTGTIACTSNAMTAHGLEERAISVDYSVILGVERLQLSYTVLNKCFLNGGGKVLELRKPQVLVKSEQCVLILVMECFVDGVGSIKRSGDRHIFGREGCISLEGVGSVCSRLEEGVRSYRYC